jgi:hypothetical protein
VQLEKTCGMNRRKNSGAVLILTMIFLLLLTIIAGTVMQTSQQEFQMAGNNQFREEASLRAQAIASEISSVADNFPVTGGVGYTVCDPNDPDADCNTENFLAAPGFAAAPEGVDVSYQVVRQGPLLLESLPFRQSESSVSSSPAFDAAIFEVSVEVDGSAARLGRAEVVQGVAVVVASSSQ